MSSTVCDNCGLEFQKPESELLRNSELKRRNYCSRQCVGKSNASNLGKYLGVIPSDIHKNIPSQRDEFSGFRVFLRRAKRRDHKVTIELQDLKDLWNNQKGKCVYTGVDLLLPTSGSNDYIYTASLDRIDSSKGYEPGNIQFTSIAINLMKGQLTHEETLKLMQIIQNGRKSLD